MFKRIHLRNIRSCSEVEIKNLGEIVALLGRNGAGKTNILLSIDWAARSATSGQISILHPAGAVYHPDSSISDLPSASFDLLLDGQPYNYSLTAGYRSVKNEKGQNSITTHIAEEISWTEPGEAERTTITRKNEIVTINSVHPTPEMRIGDSGSVLRAFNSLLASDSPLSVHTKKLSRFFSTVRYYPAEHQVNDGDVPVVQVEAYRNWLRQYEASGTTGDSTVNRLIAMYLQDREKLKILETVLRDKLGVIQQITIHPFPFDSTMIRGAGGAEKPDTQFFIVQFTPTGGRFPVAIGDLSFGTHRLLKMIASVVFDDSSVFLIEQPEDGMHVGLADKLDGTFRSFADPAQFILATHSTAIQNGLNPEEINLVALVDGKTTVRPLSAGEQVRAREYMDDEGTMFEYISIVADGE